MKKIITISLLALFLCITMPTKAMVPQEAAPAQQKTESQKSSTESKKKTQSQSQSSPNATTTKNTPRATTRRQNTTEAAETTEKATSTPITSTEPSTTSTSGNNSALFGKNKMLSIAAWSLIGIGVLFVLIVVLGGKSRRNRRPFQKSTKRYKNKSKYNNYSDRYRSNIKRK